MGNKCSNSSCSRHNRGNLFGCFGHSKKSKSKSGTDVLPEGLHASGTQERIEDNVSTMCRPSSLEVQVIAQEENNSKFPIFPLHGVQKSSPLTTNASCNDSSPGRDILNNVDIRKIEKLFEKYKSGAPSEDIILADGVERFCLDLDVDPTEFIVLALAWKFNAETMCKFTRKEFTDGFLNLHCDSIELLKSAFKKIELDALENFKELYRYTFQFALDADQGQRSLPCQIAIAMWKVVFTLNAPTLLEPWLTFLQQNNVRGISRDTWNMFLYLTESLKEDYSNYNDNEAWPSLFDDFVEHQKSVASKKTLTNGKEKEEIDPTLDIPSDASEITEATTLPSCEDPVLNVKIAPDPEDFEDVPEPEIPGTITSSTESCFQDAETPLEGGVGDSNEHEVDDKVDEVAVNDDGAAQNEMLSQLHADSLPPVDLQVESFTD